MFKEILIEARVKKLSIKNMPKTIKGSEYEDAEFYKYDKTSGSYEYNQIEYTPDGSGDYDYGEYNQGYTLNCDIKIVNKEIHLTTEVKDLGNTTHKSFSKKYSGLVFSDIDTFVTQVEKIIKEFDKI